MVDKNFLTSAKKDSDGIYIAYNTDESPYTLIGRGATVLGAKAGFLSLRLA